MEGHAREWVTNRTDEVPGLCIPAREGTPHEAGIKPGHRLLEFS
jgi:hypothetical protein